jgi:uncharacterized ubiquitin-like protein YukD
MNTIKSTNTALMFFILTPMSVMASDISLITNLKTCAVLTKVAVRLQCFDDLTKKATIYIYNEKQTVNQDSVSEINSSEINKANTLAANSKLADTQAKVLTAKQIDDFS